MVTAARRVGKAGRKSERPTIFVSLSSISDKNKVNGEWGCRRDGCCSTGVGGVDDQGELLRGNDASQARPYQSERGKAKSTSIDATGHAEYNEDAFRFAFRFSSLVFFPLFAR